MVQRGLTVAVSVACVVLLGAVACGPKSAKHEVAGGSGGGGGAPPMTTVTDVPTFERALNEALCRYLFECPSENDDNVGARLALGTEARCVEVLNGSPLSAPAHQDLDAKVRAGSIELRLDQVPACLAALSSCDADHPLSLDSAPCRAVFRGSSPLGGSCSRPEDCASDARCAAGATCPGICTARTPVGATCKSSDECDDHDGIVRCVYGDTASTCQRITFQSPAALGQSCTWDTYGATTIVPCAVGAFCALADQAASTGVCKAPAAANGACSVGDVCAGDQYCTDGRCRTPSFAGHEGAACDKLTEFCDLLAGYACTSGTCHRAGDGSEGAACSPVQPSCPRQLRARPRVPRSRARGHEQRSELTGARHVRQATRSGGPLLGSRRLRQPVLSAGRHLRRRLLLRPVLLSE